MRNSARHRPTAPVTMPKQPVSGSSTVSAILQPRIDLAREHLDAVDGLVMLQESGLAHDQEMAVAADMIPMLLELREHLIRGAREHGASFDRAFDRALLGSMGADDVVSAAGELDV